MAILNFKPLLYVLNVSDFENKELFNKAYDVLNSERKEKIDRFLFEKDKRLSLGVGVLLRYALQKANISDYNIVLGQNGKPYLKNGDIYFNLSHSGEMAVCVIAPFEVGCDIELAATPNMKIAKRFFTDEEYSDIIASTDSEDRFYRYWTLKESFIKATGYGMKMPLDAFSINLNGNITVNQNIDSRDYCFREIGGIDNYRCAVCGLQDLGNMVISVKTPNEIISEMII